MTDDSAAPARTTVVLERAGRRVQVEPGSEAERRAHESGFAPIGEAGLPDYAGMTWFALLAVARRLGFRGRTKAEALQFLRQRGLSEVQQSGSDHNSEKLGSDPIF